jgi:hypothetical protein
MPQHLISVDEAVAMLETIGAAKETIRRFRQQAAGVLAARPGLGAERVIVTSLYGAKSQQPGVNLQLGDVRLQMDVKSAQKVGLDILAATEAAISDAAVVQLLVDKLGIDVDRASHVLLDLRERRQGARDTVFHQ